MKHMFSVQGKPAAQGSKRHVGNGRMVEQSKNVGPWREAVKAAIITDLGPNPVQLAGPIKAVVTFWFQRPKYHYRADGTQLKPNAPEWFDKAPDIDKCLRSTFDALTDSGVIRDDSQIVVVEVQQRYVTPNPNIPPGAAVALYELDPHLAEAS